MREYGKALFVVLCVLMWAINGYISSMELKTLSLEVFIGAGLGRSVVSIALWSCIGVVLSNIALFFGHLVSPDKEKPLNLYQKASLGLAAGILLKIMFPSLP